jgi:hypothetical protein
MTKRLEIDAVVEVRPGGNYAGKIGIIRDIGHDCSGRKYLVEFLKPVTIGGKKFIALPFLGRSLKVTFNQPTEDKCK